MKKYDMFYNPKYNGTVRFRKKTGNAVVYTVLILISIIWIFPFIYLFFQSLAPKYEQGTLFPAPAIWTFNNYRALFDRNYTMVVNGVTINTVKSYPFWRWFLNTFIVACITSVLQTILTLMTAYAFSRLRFKTRKNYMKLMLVIGMFPGFLGMIITYWVLSAIGLTSGYAALFGLVLVYIGGSAMNYYIAKGFFDTISTSLDEAAMMDGANKNTIFWKVIMPLSKPIIVYTILLAFTAPWGEYMMVSVLAQGNNQLYNVAYGLQQMMTKEDGQYWFPVFCAAGVVVSIPIMALFFWLQKYYVEGVTGGAVKG